MKIDLSGFPKIGNMIYGNGLSAIFDADNVISNGYAQETVGWAGINCSSNPQKIDFVRIWGATNGWDGSGSCTPVYQQLFAKNGAAPTSSTDGTFLGDAGTFMDNNTRHCQEIASSNWWDAWDYIWIRQTTGVYSLLSGIELFTPEIPEISSSKILPKQCNNMKVIQRYGGPIHEFRRLFKLNQSSAVTFKGSVDYIHRYDITGQADSLSCAGRIIWRTANDLSSLPQASWNYGRATGNNLMSFEMHYTNIDPWQSVQLPAGYVEASIYLNANRMNPTGNYFAAVLCEYGSGLNLFEINIQPNTEMVYSQ